jgi:hypothetical protein
MSTLLPQSAVGLPSKNTELRLMCFLQLEASEAPAREAEIVTGERRLIEFGGGRAAPVDRSKSTDLILIQ